MRYTTWNKKILIEQMKNLIYGEITKIEKNENFAFNVNDKAAVRKNQIWRKEE